MSGKALYDKRAELLELRRTYLNVEMAIQTIKACSEVMETVQEFTEQVTDKKYYHALKILENLKMHYLPKVKDYGFGKLLESSIIDMESKLREGVNSDKNKWLQEMNHSTHEIGVMAMRRMEKRQRVWVSRGGAVPDVQRHVSPVVDFVLDEESEDQEYYGIEMRPFFQCLHINTKLGHQAEFRREFINDRQGQYDNIRPKPDMLDSWTIGPFESMLYDLAGFFIMEHRLYTSSQDFRAKSDVDALWEQTTEDLLKLLAPKVQHLRRDERLQRSVYGLLETFTYILEEYAYD
ncbi:Rab GTPase-binding exocyst subunit S15, partial [Spiromyces aspiralis]